MEKLLKWALATVAMVNVLACGTVNVATAGEWSDISSIEGRYSRIYFDYTVDGNTGTFYCINDWMVNQDDGGINGGLLSNEYNRFNFKVGIDDYEIRIYPTGYGQIYKDTELCGDTNDPCTCVSLPGLVSACCWTTSPSMPTIRHTIWEFSFELQERMIGFEGYDPDGPTIVVNPNPPEPPPILTSGPSVFAHTVDGKFTDDSADCMLSPVPSRSYQEPVRDPFFDEHDGGAGWTIELNTENGGVKITTASTISAYEQDIKWSQPPVEVNNGVINGWDEVSIIDSNSNCWNCPTQSHGDADCDGYVGSSDSAILVAAYDTNHWDPNYNPCADFDRDGDVDASDQSIMMAYWGTNPPGDSPLARPILSDDWVCLDERPVTDIHWWGSFKGWTGCIPPADKPKAFRLGIWTDVPDPNRADPNNFSHPGRLIWENICDSYVWSYAGYDLDPRGIEPREACFKFDQLLSQDEWFYQDPNDSNNGTVYWLSIAAIYDPCKSEPNHPWGWKTRPHFYNDDAVRIADVNGDSWPPTIGAVWESGEPIEYPAGTSWDMAFALTTNRKFFKQPYAEPLERDPNWSPVPVPVPIPVYRYRLDYDRNGVIDLRDFSFFAESYLIEGQLWPEPNGP